MTLAEDDSEESPTLGETLRALRQEEGMTVAELANLLSITGSAVREWESDNHYPIAKHYQDLISLFPPLASFKEGRGISKPVGQTFVQRKSETAPPAPVVSEDAFAIDSREVFRMMEEGTESANVNGARRIIRAKKESPMNSLTSLGKIAPQITTVMV